MTNLIVFPPSLLLMQLFRKSKRRTNELKKIKKIQVLNESFYSLKSKFNTQNAKKSDKKSFSLPWWCKIIAYILSLIFVSLSIFFIIAQGITFGDEKVKKWLTSFFISILSSIFFTQPIKVIYFLLSIC